MNTLNTTPAEATLIALIDQSYTVTDMTAETGKTDAAVRSMLNRMTKKGLIAGGSTAPALINGSLKPACPAPTIIVKHQHNEWLVGVHGSAFSGRIAKTRPAALEAAVEECTLRNIGHFTLVNKLGRTVSYTLKGGKAIKGSVA